MAAKKTSVKKTASAKKSRAKKSPVKKKTSFLGGFFRRLVAVALFLLISLGAGVGYYFIKNTSVLPPQQADTRVVKTPGFEKPSDVKAEKPKFEIFPDTPVTKPIPSKPVLPPSPDRRPKVAIIIDDLGYDRNLAEKFLSIDAPLTYSILPHSPYRREIANAARLKGSEIMLHLPMEPDEYPAVDPGLGALLSGMSPDERISMLKKNLESVPYISGVNNHMGSKMSANSEHMNQILSIMKKRGLYYIDSLTSHNSLSYSSARLFQVPFATRDIFLDHDPDIVSIRSRVRQLVHLAELNGQAIGIAHPYESTHEVLLEMMPMLRERVQIIPASEAVRLSGY